MLLIVMFSGVVVAGPVDDLGGKVAKALIGVGKFFSNPGGGAQGDVASLMRVLYILIIALIVHIVARMVPPMRRHLVAFTVLGIGLGAIISLFTPDDLLIGLGSTYATVAALIFFGLPIAGATFLSFHAGNEQRWASGMKFVLNLILYIIISSMVTYMKKLSGFQLEDLGVWLAYIPLAVAVIFFVKWVSGWGHGAKEENNEGWEWGKKLGDKVLSRIHSDEQQIRAYAIKEQADLNKLETEVNAASDNDDLKKRLRHPDKIAIRDAVRWSGKFKHFETLAKKIQNPAMKTALRDLKAVHGSILANLKSLDTAIGKGLKSGTASGYANIAAKKTDLLKRIAELKKFDADFVSRVQAIQSIKK